MIICVPCQVKIQSLSLTFIYEKDDVNTWCFKSHKLNRLLCPGLGRICLARTPVNVALQ
jgi:hypothetical protein